MDRNGKGQIQDRVTGAVALRKESVDRNEISASPLS